MESFSSSFAAESTLKSHNSTSDGAVSCILVRTTEISAEEWNFFLLSQELHLDRRRVNFIRAVAGREWIVTNASTKLHDCGEREAN